MKELIEEHDVLEAWRRKKKEIAVPANSIITPAALDAAKIRGIRFVSVSQEPKASESAISEKLQTSQKVVIGSDHGGFELKETLKNYLIELGCEVEDVGTYSTESVDYPDYALLAAEKVARDTSQKVVGIVIDGAGVGSAMAANKVPGIRAATCHDVYTARNSREHNNANVLTLGSRALGVDVAREIVRVWLETEFAGGRHQRRVDKITKIESKFTR